MSTRGHRGAAAVLRGRTPVVRLALVWLLLGCAWAWANPPLAAPDEADHFVRIVGIAQGHWVGAPAPEARIGVDPAEIAFDRQTQRAVTVPAALDPVPYNCYLSNPRLGAACLDRPPPRGPAVRLITTVGDYPPAGLLAPAATVRAVSTLPAAIRLGRTVALLISLALIVAAAAALYDAAAGWISLGGIIAAVTPAALFLAASLNPSGMSIAAAIALVAGLLRVSRGCSGAAPAWVWGLAGLGGALLAASHPTGLLWTLVLLGAFGLWQGRSGLRRLASGSPGGRRSGLGLLGAGLLAAVAWQLAYGPNTPIAYRAVRTALARLPSQYWSAVRQSVAGFGYLEFRVPLLSDLAWLALVAALVGFAAWLSPRPGRRALALTGVGVVVIPALAWLIAGRAAGIGMDGREYMPLLVALPLLAGELLVRGRPGRWARRGLGAGVAVAAAVQLIDWYLNGRRAAVGISGPLMFLGRAAWSPPGGWVVWIVPAVIGALGLASLPLRGRGRPQPDRAAPTSGERFELVR